MVAIQNTIAALVMIGSLLCSCNTEKRDAKFSRPRADNNSNKLKLNGYYYQADEDQYWSFCLLYQNGIYLYGSAEKKTDIHKQEEMYSSGEYKDYAKTKKHFWGIYYLEDSTITIEKWCVENIFSRYGKEVKKGVILNDTTFIITSSQWFFKKKKNDELEYSDTFRFHQFSPKPDSTNQWIK